MVEVRIRQLRVRVADPSHGEVAETDFGLLGSRRDPTTGCLRAYGLLVAWVLFGGIARRVIVGNLTLAVTRPDRYTPGLNRVSLRTQPAGPAASCRARACRRCLGTRRRRGSGCARQESRVPGESSLI
jgi:hypothetical protein